MFRAMHRIGALLGAVIGVAYTFFLMWQTKQANPDDPSAGSIGIMIIFLLPAGAFVGWLLSVVISLYLKYFTLDRSHID